MKGGVGAGCAEEEEADNLRSVLGVMRARLAISTP